MAEVAAQQQRPAKIVGTGLKLVLFGMPGAGKSSLLGALAQVSETQEHLLNARIVDRSDGRFVELQRQLHRNEPRQTLDEIVAYPVTFEPLGPQGEAKAKGQDVVLVDCDGRVANDILVRRRPINGKPADGALAKAILSADTLILVVDASKRDQLETDFDSFTDFLRLFEARRGERSEVGGLPVYLVLTKCDLLAKQNDTISTWMQRIEERKRQVAHRFRSFLANRAEQEHQPFGQIHLDVWATSVHRPPLATRPAKSAEPYQVAELFRQCMKSANEYRGHRKKATQRLSATVGGVTAVVAVMLLIAIGFLLTRPSDEAQKLDQKLGVILMPENATAEQRLEMPSEDARDKIDKLQEIIDTKDFNQLPIAKRQRARFYLNELKAYHETFKRKLDEIPRLSTIKTEEELDAAEEQLKKLALPEEYAKTWQRTPLGEQLGKAEKNIEAFREAVTKQLSWYATRYKEAKELSDAYFNMKPPEFVKKVKASMFLNKKPPYPDTEESLPGAPGVTNRTIYDFNTVKAARRKAETPEQRVERFFKAIEATMSETGALLHSPNRHLRWVATVNRAHQYLLATNVATHE